MELKKETTALSRRNKLLLLSLSVIFLVSLIVVFSNNQNPFQRSLRSSYKPGVSQTSDRAVNQARKVYEEKKQLGIDLTNGPCLTNDLLPDWVVDIAHSPRQKIDDLPQNQCQAFTEGRATHFVEMDAEGNILQVR